MPSTLCWETRDGRRICIPIFYERVKFPPDWPGPDPHSLARLIELIVTDARPNPWISDERLTPEVVQDLEVLAAINDTLQQASSPLRETVQRTIQDSLAQLSLPEGVTVEFDQVMG